MTKIHRLIPWIIITATLLPIGVSAHEKTVFVLFDLSESTAQSTTREKYLEGFIKIIDIKDIRNDLGESFIQPGDVIVADIISDNSISGSTFPILKEFKKFSVWRDNSLLFKKKFRREKEEQVIKVHEILFNPERKIMFTDILSSLRIAERVFNRFNKAENILVIFSDMKEDSAEYNFARERLTDKRIEEIIGKEHGKGLPDLKGVKVYVAGALADDRRYFRNIQRFWTLYFKGCGAILEASNYGRGFMGIHE